MINPLLIFRWSLCNFSLRLIKSEQYENFKKLKIGGCLIDPMPKSHHQSTSKYMTLIKENVCLDIGSETVTVITKPKFNGFSVTEPAERFPC